MEKKKYISITYGILKFSNGKKIKEGDFVPANISDEEIREKLKRKQIAVFDNEIAAVVQASNKNKIDLLNQMKSEFKRLTEKYENLQIEYQSALESIEIFDKENEELRNQLKKAGKK